MREEVLRILKMVEEGKIDSEKASELIEALKGAKAGVTVASNQQEKMLRVKVLSKNNDTVNVTLPIKLVKGVISACGKIPIGRNGETLDIDTKTIIEAIDNGLVGKIVDVQSAEGDLVEVTID